MDSLPESVRLSQVLTGNDLGKLGSLQSAPTAPEVEKVTSSHDFRRIYSKHNGNYEKALDEVHKLAHSLIKDNQAQEALKLLLAANSLNIRDL